MAKERRALKKDWILTEDAFNRLLAWFDPDRDRAAAIYEKSRHKLITRFIHRNCIYPEALADETFDRVARKISEGEEIRSSDPFAFIHGVAVNVAREDARAQAQYHEVSIESHQEIGATNNKQEEPQPRMKCLKICLRTLPHDERVLIDRFYRGQKNELIRNRRELALHLGIPNSTLRVRAHRIRVDVEKCVRGCVEKMPRAEGQD